MDEKKKILLGEKDIMSRDNEDLFINVNLNSTFAEIRDYKYDNVFDVEKQWKKERNTSRDFRIYGIVDSTIIDCDNLTIYAYDSAYPGTGINSGTTQLSGLVATVTSSELVYNGLNSYAKKRGKYIFEISGYTKDFIYFKIPSNNFTYKDQVYSQRLIFRDADGVFIEYGTQTIDITENGDAVEINNDFYFLYNKHWVKKDLSIVGEKPAKISFSASPLTETVNESPLSARSVFSVVLDKPSPFGLEQTYLSVATTTLDPITEIDVFDSSSTLLTFPYNMTFAPGEQIKNFYFVSPNDNLQEFLEDVTFELSGFQYVDTGSPLTHTFYVNDATPRNRTTFNFQNIYQNRNYFTGIVITGFSSSVYSYGMPAVLRNGLEYEGTPMEFYPSDNFTLKIKNVGTNTILPVNPNLNIASEQIFLAGQQLVFNINLQYQNTDKHSIKFYFDKLNATTSSLYPFIFAGNSGIVINGIPVVDYYKQYKIDYEKFLACLKNVAVASAPTWYSSGQNISGWNRVSGIDIPFDIEENLTALTITITAKNPGTRLDVTTYGAIPDLFDAANPVLSTFGITAETVQNFVYAPQNPLEIVLGANVNNNSQAQYEFELSKVGYDTMKFTNSPVNSSTGSPVYYLASGYHDILRNWDDGTSTPVYNHSGVTSGWRSTNYTLNSLYKTGEAYINGIVFLANQYFDNTNNTSTFRPLGSASLNLSHFTNISGDYAADFLLSPITVIPETDEIYSPQTTAQEGFLLIAGQTHPTTISGHRSFDFRTGGTGAYNTYYFNNIYDANWQWTQYGVLASGATTQAFGLPLKFYIQDGYTPSSINSQGLQGTTPISTTDNNKLLSIGGIFSIASTIRVIKLKSLTPGNPFEVTNLVDMRDSSGNVYSPYGYGSIGYTETIPNQIAGVTINQANNKMGGYTLTRPSAPLISPIRAVSFEFPSYSNSSGVMTMKITLNNPSVNGNETVDVLVGSGSAILGFDYIPGQTMPYSISWAVGEKDKFITFTNTKPSFPPGSRILVLQLSNLVNLNPGPYMSTGFVIF